MVIHDLGNLNSSRIPVYYIRGCFYKKKEVTSMAYHDWNFIILNLY